MPDNLAGSVLLNWKVLATLTLLANQIWCSNGENGSIGHFHIPLQDIHLPQTQQRDACLLAEKCKLLAKRKSAKHVQ